MRNPLSQTLKKERLEKVFLPLLCVSSHSFYANEPSFFCLHSKTEKEKNFLFPSPSLYAFLMGADKSPLSVVEGRHPPSSSVFRRRRLFGGPPFALSPTSLTIPFRKQPRSLRPPMGGQRVRPRFRSCSADAALGMLLLEKSGKGAATKKVWHPLQKKLVQKFWG